VPALTHCPECVATDDNGRRATGRARRKLSLFGRAHGSYELNPLETHTEVDEADRPRAPSVEDLLRAVDADTSGADEGRPSPATTIPSPATTIYANQAAIVDQRKQMWQRQQSFVRAARAEALG
jgi:hypothetical protein